MDRVNVVVGFTDLAMRINQRELYLFYIGEIERCLQTHSRAPEVSAMVHHSEFMRFTATESR